MRRLPIAPRPNWQAEVEKWGMLYHTHEGQAYWDESAYYELTSEEVEALETATNQLHQMCLTAVEYVVRSKSLDRLGIQESAHPAIIASWNAREPGLYGRFDLAFDGTGPPKLLEYNADTPTALLEAAVVQWQWLQDIAPGADQFNSIWEHLVARWQELSQAQKLPSRVYFAHAESVEDLMTVSLLRDTAIEAGLETEGIHMDEIGWDPARRVFTDIDENHMAAIFKLYPWEWMVGESFGANALQTLARHTWIEPVWKMVLSNKAILAVLWELFPDSPYLLPTYLDGPGDKKDYVKKPIFSREGGNVQIFRDGTLATMTEGEYGGEGFVYQTFAPISSFDGRTPVIGSWVVGEEACGVGIRETSGLITTDFAQFVPCRIAP